MSEFQQPAKTFSSHSFGHQVRQNPSIKNEDKKKEAKYTRVLRSTFKEIKRDKEAKTITETDLKEAELRWIKGNKVLRNHRFKSLETVI